MPSKRLVSSAWSCNARQHPLETKAALMLQCLTCATVSTAPGLKLTVQEWIKAGEDYTDQHSFNKVIFLGCEAMYIPVSIVTEKKTHPKTNKPNSFLFRCQAGDWQVFKHSMLILKMEKTKYFTCCTLVRCIFWLSLKTFHSSCSIWQETFQLSFPTEWFHSN